MALRTLLAALIVAASLLVGPATTRPAAAATCAASVGPGIPPPTAFAAGQPGFHAQWYGQSGYPTLCPGDRSTATGPYYNAAAPRGLQPDGRVDDRRGDTARHVHDAPDQGAPERRERAHGDREQQRLLRSVPGEAARAVRGRERRLRRDPRDLPLPARLRGLRGEGELIRIRRLH